MAAIYQADIWCDDCADCIKDRIITEYLDSNDESRLDALLEDYDGPTGDDLVDGMIEWMNSVDETNYDSGEYPKHCGDNEESDCPQHCAGGEDCVNAEVGSDGTKYGCFFGNDLTSDGINYVREAVREDLRAGFNDSPAVEFWAPFYDYIDFEDDDSAPG